MQFDVIGQGTLSGATKTKGIRRGFGPILMVDPRVIEFERPLGIDDGHSEGLRLKMLLYVNHNREQSIFFREVCIKGVVNGGFARICQKEWNLSAAPTIKNLWCEAIQSDQQRKDTVTVQMSSNVDLGNATDLVAVQSASDPLELQTNVMMANSQEMMMMEPAPMTPKEAEGDPVTVPRMFTDRSSNTEGAGAPYSTQMEGQSNTPRAAAAAYTPEL